MRARHVLYALLAVMLASGVIEPVEANAPPSPVWWTVLSAFLMSFLPYYWYRLDSEGRRFHRSRWMSTSVVAMNFIGMPVYLLRSRPRGQRAIALLRCLGFAVLMVLAALVGTALRFGIS
jgi:phosphatidylglycerophosphate synthase